MLPNFEPSFQTGCHGFKVISTCTFSALIILFFCFWTSSIIIHVKFTSNEPRVVYETKFGTSVPSLDTQHLRSLFIFKSIFVFRQCPSLDSYVSLRFSVFLYILKWDIGDVSFLCMMVQACVSVDWEYLVWRVFVALTFGLLDFCPRLCYHLRIYSIICFKMFFLSPLLSVFTLIAFLWTVFAGSP